MSKLSSANGSSSAGASWTSIFGNRARSARVNSGEGSAATTVAPRPTNSRVSAPVPAPTSSTRCPSRTPAKSAKSGASRTEYRPMNSSYDSSSTWKTPLTPEHSMTNVAHVRTASVPLDRGQLAVDRSLILACSNPSLTSWPLNAASRMKIRTTVPSAPSVARITPQMVCSLPATRAPIHLETRSHPVTSGRSSYHGAPSQPGPAPAHGEVLRQRAALARRFVAASLLRPVHGQTGCPPR